MPAPSTATLLGDARSGKLAGNIGAFGRALRRAGVPVDAARIALAQQAVQLVGVERKLDMGAALEAVLVSREQDRAVFRELFDAFFRDPELAKKLLAQMLPSAEGQAAPPRQRPRVREALAPFAARPPGQPTPPGKDIDFDAAMTASDLARLKHADFNQLGASEYALVERLVRELRLPVPTVPARRTRAGGRGARVHWGRTLRDAAQSGGEVMALRRLQRRRQPLPLLLLVDVSGSMERYARLLLAFIHAATARVRTVSSAWRSGTARTNRTSTTSSCTATLLWTLTTSCSPRRAPSWSGSTSTASSTTSCPRMCRCLCTTSSFSVRRSRRRTGARKRPPPTEPGTAAWRRGQVVGAGYSAQRAGFGALCGAFADCGFLSVALAAVAFFAVVFFATVFLAGAAFLATPFVAAAFCG